MRDYIYLDDEPLAVKVYGTQAGIYYFVNDHLGTPRQAVDANGVVYWQAAYLPYGEVQINVATIENNIRFPGQYFDAETGLHYNWNRYYDPTTGRYISADPIGLEGGLNLYGYVGGDPVNKIDPKGLWFGIDDVVTGPVDEIIVIGGLAALAMAGSDWADDALDSIRDLATGESDDCSCDDNDECEQQLQRDNATCGAIARAEKFGKRPQGAAQRCYSSAMERYGNCLAGRPIGPLDTWNN